MLVLFRYDGIFADGRNSGFGGKFFQILVPFVSNFLAKSPFLQLFLDTIRYYLDTTKSYRIVSVLGYYTIRYDFVVSIFGYDTILIFDDTINTSSTRELSVWSIFNFSRTPIFLCPHILLGLRFRNRCRF